jgi:hypothetical protein
LRARLWKGRCNRELAVQHPVGDSFIDVKHVL